MAATSTQQSNAQKQAQQNAAYMHLTYNKPAKMIAQNGNAWTSGSTLNFTAPVIQGAWAQKIRVFCTFTVNYTAATAAPTISLNAAAPWSLINTVRVIYGQEQIVVHPYLLAKVFPFLRGYGRENPSSVIGNSNANIRSYLYTSPTVTAGNNTWTFFFDIPFNDLINPMNAWGMFPMGGTGTPLQVQLTTATSVTDADPLNGVIQTNGTVVVTGTVSPVVVYRDYISMTSTASYQPNLTGLPTVQVIQAPGIDPLGQGSYQYKRFTNPYQFAKLAHIVIDGQSSGTFAATSNIQGYELDQAENPNSAFFRYDSTTSGNADLDYYFSEVEDLTGQDLDDGVLFYDPTIRNLSDSDLRAGTAYLNLAGGDPSKPGSGGFPAARYGVKVGTVSSANGITPRVVTYGVIINPKGIQVG